MCHYSVDTSALIGLKDDYPQSVFPRIWDLVGSIAEQKRLWVCKQVEEECNDLELMEFFDSHAVPIPPLSYFERHLGALQKVLGNDGLLLTKPSATKTEADPFVVALGLLLDGRDPSDPMVQTRSGGAGVVVSLENPKSSVKIPAACRRFKLPHFSFIELLQAEGYSG
jgi:hypothetical protein